MSNTKKEHYVPRCYLNNFTFRNGKIHVFDKSNATIRRNQNIFDVAMENYFYDVDMVKEIGCLPEENQESIYTELSKILKTEDRQEINKFLSSQNKFLEKTFADLESEYSIYLNKISKASNRKFLRNYFGISKRIKKIFSKYIAIQIIRTKSVRESIRDINEKLNKELIYREYKKQDIDITKEEIVAKSNKVFVKLQHSLLILNEEYINRLSEIIQSHIWVLYVNKTDTPFYTSDNPVVTIPHINDKYKSYSGFNSKGVEVVFPINSKLLLAMYEKSYHSNEFKDCQFVEVKNVERIDIYNSMQVLLCHRNVFSENDNFDIAIELCKSDSKIMNINNKVDIKWG